MGPAKQASAVKILSVSPEAIVSRRSSLYPAVGAKDILFWFVLAVFLDTVAGLTHWPEVMVGSLGDPDTYMRLVWLRDMIEQREILHKVMRDSSGAGSVMHWSHLLTGALFVLAMPFRLFFTLNCAIEFAAILLGPLSVGLLAVAAAWATSPLAEREWRWMAAIAASLSAPALNYGHPGVADHHVLLAAAVMAMAGYAGRIAIGDKTAAYGLGFVAGLAIWLTPEAYPFVLMSFGACWLAWLLAARQQAEITISPFSNINIALIVAGSVLFLVVALSLIIDPPLNGAFSAELDRLSVAYLFFAGIIAAICGALWRLSRIELASTKTAAIGVAFVVLGVALWFALFPALLFGVSGILDASAVQIFLNGTEEMRAIHSIGEACAFLIDGVVATLGIIWFAFSRRSWLWSYAVCCAGITILMGIMHRRFVIYEATVAATILPPMLTEVTALMKGRAETLRATARILLVCLVIASNRVVAAISVPDKSIQTGVASPGELQISKCDLANIDRMLSRYANRVVLTDINDVPELLYRTRILTVASLYHRNVSAYSKLTEAWRSEPSVSTPLAIRDTKAAFLLFCRRRQFLAPDLPPGSLEAHLRRGDVPHWLKEEASDPASGYVLYRVEP